MKIVVKSLPVAFKMIVRDPVNIILSLFPTGIALSLYLFTIMYVYQNSDRLVAFFRGYIYTSDQATLIGKVLTALLIIFIFFLMSWTFIIVVGIISAPFNSLLSARIEKKLSQSVNEDSTQLILEKIGKGLVQTFINEFKKIFFIVILGIVAFILNLFPLFYPIGISLVAVLLAVQFVDYSWSRYDLRFTACVKDTLKNIIPYTLGGFIFLMLIAIPIVNAFMPALATSYFTVLWHYRQKKISQSF